MSLKIVYNKYYKLAVAVDKMLGRNSRRVRYKKKNPTVSYENSVFLYYPSSEYVRNRPSLYGNLRSFVASNKRRQREVLDEFLHVPRDDKFPKIIRPLRTRGGKGYILVETQEEMDSIDVDFDYWVQSVFPKMAEYRIIYVYGNPCVALRKYPKNENDELDPKEPWNAGEDITFVTINLDCCNLVNTSFFDDAKNFLEEYPLDIAAFDVGWRKDKSGRHYSVFEVNCAPEISIENNLELVVERIKEGRQ